jgi:DnaK suppressor protein
MTPDQQIPFRAVIDERLKSLAQELAELEQSTEAISPDVSIGRLSRLDSMQHQQIALANKRRLEDERSRLLEAQRRIDAGTYGRCLLCGGDIAIERLEIQPDAVTCVPCTRKR